MKVQTSVSEDDIVTIQIPTRDERRMLYATEFEGACMCEDCLYEREIMFRMVGLREACIMLDTGDMAKGGPFEVIKDMILEHEPRYSC